MMGKGGATLQIIIKRVDGAVETDLEKQMPGMDSYQVRQLLALAYPVSSVMKSIVYNSALRIADKDEEDLVFEGECFEI
eukprot:6466229-Karenia_brevis.AAC.1